MTRLCPASIYLTLNNNTKRDVQEKTNTKYEGARTI